MTHSLACSAPSCEARCLPCRLYNEEKIQENLECEIMHVVVEEARDSYRSVQLSFPRDIILHGLNLTWATFA